MKKSKLLIIDGHAMIHRAYHALPPLRTKSGIPTNAIYGFFSMLYLALQGMKPDYVVVAFDTPVPTFRKKLLDTYQASRPAPEENLVQQFNLIKELLDAAQVCRLEAPGFEADDVIGTLAVKYAGPNLDVHILTGDKDILQLVNDNVKVVMPKIGLSQTVEYDAEAVHGKMLVYPEHIPDYKALCGDPSDNYSAIRGIGPKTAIKLLTQFKTVENMYEKLEELADEKLKLKLKEGEEAVKLLKHIATIHTTVPIEIPPIDQMKADPFTRDLKDTFQKYEMSSMLRRYFPETVEKKVETAPDTTTPAGTPPAQTPLVGSKPKKDTSQMDMF